VLLGVGGFFNRKKSPKRIGGLYEKHLGLKPTGHGSTFAER
jgi:hypothetical protein